MSENLNSACGDSRTRQPETRGGYVVAWRRPDGRIMVRGDGFFLPTRKRAEEELRTARMFSRGGVDYFILAADLVIHGGAK